MRPLDPSEFEAFSRYKKPSVVYDRASILALVIVGGALAAWYCAVEILGVGSLGSLPLGSLLLVCVGIAMMLSGQLEIAQRRRLRDRPIVAIRDAPDGLVEIHGTVSPGEQGTVKTPLSERDVVWAHVAVEETSDGSVREVLEESTNRDFFVDDGSGEIARVVGARAVFVPPAPDQHEDRLAHPLRVACEYFSDRMRAYVHARGRPVQSVDTLVAEEVALAPGEEIVALGVARRVITAGNDDAYRGTSSLLVMGGAEGEAGEVLLARARPLRALWPMRFRFGLLLFVSGTLAAAVETVWSLVR